MSSLNVASEEIALVKQNNQRRYVKLQVINRVWRTVAVIQGKLISCNVSIDGDSNVQRTASISIETESDYVKTPYGVIDLQRDLPIDYYIKIWAGIEDANTLRVRWYSQGVFIIAQSSYNFDPATRTLSMSLVDLMTDLNGERGGELHAYTSIVKNEQRIDDVIKSVLDLVGISTYSVEPITVLRPVNEPFDPQATENDYMVPYDIDFSVGVTAYEIIEKLVGLYPYWEMGFDANGMFYVRKEMLEQDDSYVVINAEDIASLVLSEDVSIDWNYVRNHIEVWGKDGKYYGEADDDNPESPFQVNAIPIRRLVVKDNEYGIDTNSICDRYRDEELAETLLAQQAKIEEQIAALEAIENPTQTEKTELETAKTNLNDNLNKQKQNVDISGNEIAEQFAQRILYDRTRLQDNITIQTVCMPFLNDVGFKISYRTKVDDIIRPYMVKSINHDYAAGTTTLNMIRFYNDQCVSYWQQLDTPVIISAQGVGLDAVITIGNVEYAETYALFIDGIQVGKYTSTTMIYGFQTAGTHTVRVAAMAPYFQTSELSDSAIVTVSPVPATTNVIITDAGDYITTNDGYKVKYNEE